MECNIYKKKYFFARNDLYAESEMQIDGTSNKPC